jgi:uncharacterized membrane protein
MPLFVAFAFLLGAGVVWFLLHAAVAGSPLRFWLIERVGAKAYRGGFSLASVASLIWLIHEYGRAPYLPLWLTPRPLLFVPIALVPIAFVFLVGAFTVPSPTAVGGERVLAKQAEARGVMRVTRHPFLWSVVIWSIAHLLANRDPGSFIFFGSVGLTALRGAFDIDRKRRRTNPEEFARFEAVTSNVPFGAVWAGRNRLVLRELWLPLLLGLALALGTVALHSRFFGASAVPGLHGF